MSLDFTHDYSNHNLLDNAHKYTKIYKLSPTDTMNVHCGDKLLLQTTCGEYGLFIATEDTGEDGILHVTQLREFSFTKDGTITYPDDYSMNGSGNGSNDNNSTNNACDCDPSLCDPECACGCTPASSTTSCNCSNHNTINTSCNCGSSSYYCHHDF